MASPVDLGYLPSQVKGIGRRFGIQRLEQAHNPRLMVGVYVLINSAISIAILSAVAVVTKEPFVFPSLGPTAFLLFFAALKPTASPRNVFCGHLIGVIAGFVALLIFGLATVPADLEDITWARLGAVAFALSVTLAVMVWLGVPHAPAGATTLIVALGLLHTPLQLLILMVAVVVLIGQGFVINRLAGLPYPVWNPVSDSVADAGSAPGST